MIRPFREEVIRTLGMMGPQAAEAISPLKSIILSGVLDTPLCNYAAEALIRIDPENQQFYRGITGFGPAGPKTLAKVLELLDDETIAAWRYRALTALQLMAKRSSSARMESEEAYFHPEIVCLDMSSAIAPLRRRLKADDDGICLKVIEILEAMHVDPTQDQDPEIRERAQKLRGKLK